MSNTKKYRLTRKTLVRTLTAHADGTAEIETIKAGEIFVPTDSELESFSDRLQPVIEVSRDREPMAEPDVQHHVQARVDEQTPDAPAETEEPSIFDQVKSMTVNGVMAAVEEERFSAEVALAMERQGQKRKSLIAQLESLIEAGV